MTSSLINIGRSGAAAARASLELTAQNIANAANPDYSRRRLNQSELVGTSVSGFNYSDTLIGVRITGIDRFENETLQRQARDASSDLGRTNAELTGLRDAETALEQSNVYSGLVELEASLTLLESDPTDSALRTGALETARQLANTLNTADAGLETARTLTQSEINAGLEVVSGAATELARINAELGSAREGTAGRAALLDARDAALTDISEQLGISVSFESSGAAQVRINGSPEPILVQGSSASAVTASYGADGTAQFSVGATSFAPESGQLAGRAAALTGIAGLQDELDVIANATITRANDAQANGAALDGSGGQPFFSGTSASDIAVALSDGEGIATAPAGSPANSRDTSNLGNLLIALGGNDGPIKGTDTMLLSLSSRIAGLNTTHEGLTVIADSARATLSAQTGVNLDDEAANLVRLQQAFEANSRVIQVASDLFDTILSIR
ncbi:MAG: flagellar hook-associated protein FlgK [Erythrobacter sp.]